MIQKQTILSVADNSGAKKVICIGVFGGSRKRTAQAGDLVKVAVRESIPSAKAKKGTVLNAVVVRTKYGSSRGDGSKVSFGENAVVLLKEGGDPIGTRIFGAVTRELRTGHPKIVSLASAVL